MKRKKAKLILFYTFSVLTIFTLIVWYLLPFITTKWFLHRDKAFHKYLNIRPSYINKLPSPPKEWDEINIGDLTFKIPLSECIQIRGGENYIFFKLESGGLTISAIGLSKYFREILDKEGLKYPTLLTYQKRVAIFESQPSDISILNSRNKNNQAAENQFFKALAIRMGCLSEINIVNTDLLKSVCQKSERRKHGFSASVDIYSPNEAMVFTIFLTHYRDKGTLDSYLLRILGGIKVPNHPVDAEVVQKDIKAIIAKHSDKT